STHMCTLWLHIYSFSRVHAVHLLFSNSFSAAYLLTHHRASQALLLTAPRRALHTEHRRDSAKKRQTQFRSPFSKLTGLVSPICRVVPQLWGRCHDVGCYFPKIGGSSSAHSRVVRLRAWDGYPPWSPEARTGLA
ncbi:hypothetical protein C8J57DRAFT_1345752, partial [Mycena rebaudengoi]